MDITRVNRILGIKGCRNDEGGTLIIARKSYVNSTLVRLETEDSDAISWISTGAVGRNNLRTRYLKPREYRHSFHPMRESLLYLARCT